MPIQYDFAGFVGGSYTAPDPYQDAQVCVNYFVEISADDHSKTKTVLLGTPGLLQVATVVGL
jgi:hypothetical protein